MAGDKCEWCGAGLTPEEIEYPRTDQDGDNLCDDCYRDHFQFDCDRCGEYEESDEQDKFLAVHEGTGRVAPGVYEIIKFPYYTSGLIGSSWLHEWALRRVADVTWDGDGWYPCGHLCTRCRNELNLEQSAEGIALHAEAAN